MLNPVHLDGILFLPSFVLAFDCCCKESSLIKIVNSCLSIETLSTDDAGSESRLHYLPEEY